jgi:Fur family ferric uptake transcriptional regulator
VTVPQRQTRQRAEIVELLGGLEEFRSAQQLHDLLRARGSSVSLATVYRAMQSLSDSGDVDVLLAADGEALYRWCERKAHHHHLVCRECGTAVEIDGPNVERWADAVAAEHGFADVAHTLELFGTCRACRTARG